MPHKRETRPGRDQDVEEPLKKDGDHLLLRQWSDVSTGFDSVGVEIRESGLPEDVLVHDNVPRVAPGRAGHDGVGCIGHDLREAHVIQPVLPIPPPNLRVLSETVFKKNREIHCAKSFRITLNLLRIVDSSAPDDCR